MAPSPIHGKGVFAKVRIPKGTRIGTYRGPRARRNGKYVLWIYKDKQKPFGVRGTNPLRFLNHSRRPNAAFDGLQLYAIAEIKPGEELTIDYGQEWH